MPRRLLFALVLALALPGPAQAVGGHYTFDGGSPDAQAVVRQSLDVSRFNWDVVPPVVIHMDAPVTGASPGHIWVAAALPARGTYAYGLIQHEYAHQVEYFLLSPRQREAFFWLLAGTVDRIADDGGASPHSAYSAERFASHLAWAYWPVPENSVSPSTLGVEAGVMGAGMFRYLLEHALRANPKP